MESVKRIVLLSSLFLSHSIRAETLVEQYINWNFSYDTPQVSRQYVLDFFEAGAANDETLLEVEELRKILAKEGFAQNFARMERHFHRLEELSCADLKSKHFEGSKRLELIQSLALKKTIEEIFNFRRKEKVYKEESVQALKKLHGLCVSNNTPRHLYKALLEEIFYSAKIRSDLMDQSPREFYRLQRATCVLGWKFYEEDLRVGSEQKYFTRLKARLQENREEREHRNESPPLSLDPRIRYPSMVEEVD